MKRITSALSVLALSLALSLPANAAPKTIQVYIDGSPISFTAGAPYTRQGTTLVPFRALFEKLGLQVDWNAKTQTVTGKKKDLAIGLTIGSNRATVNGIVKKLSLSPVTVKGTTYIPLRFIGEASGADVEWDSDSNSIYIYTAASKALDEQQIRGLLDQSIEYFNSKDLAKVLTLTSFDSPLRDEEESMKEHAETYLKTSKIVDFDIINVDSRMGEAVVQTTEESTRTGGFYTPDSRADYIYTLVKEEGAWKIYSVESQYVEYFISDEALTGTTNIPSADETSLKQLIDTYFNSLNDKNVDVLFSTLDPSIATDEFRDSFISYFKDNEYKTSLSNFKVIYYTTNQAAVYLEEKIAYTIDNETYEDTYKDVFVVDKSQSGKWLISATYSLDE
ncbi:copper amine oxidase N-terminal domain-containing protein [Paenibacillus sp. YPG26]|uniref:copper amine oxidase N-terminal domain-containing protein n=1 Tax=Paenibacillus sp. YPG26 TaxID=2878915 RepID=UPI00203B36D3|nr:copper amine oxidase N-terminal domain-containing protein [Paenibacillus sp. YPG26]USB32570.1 copper amine oxidase N-terminal domain-containing protein [Paenibacillus sp. YPG26]